MPASVALGTNTAGAASTPRPAQNFPHLSPLGARHDSLARKEVLGVIAMRAVVQRVTAGPAPWRSGSSPLHTLGCTVRAGLGHCPPPGPWSLRQWPGPSWACAGQDSLGLGLFRITLPRPLRCPQDRGAQQRPCRGSLGPLPRPAAAPPTMRGNVTCGGSCAPLGRGQAGSSRAGSHQCQGLLPSAHAAPLPTTVACLCLSDAPRTPGEWWLEVTTPTIRVTAHHRHSQAQGQRGPREAA